MNILSTLRSQPAPELGKHVPEMGLEPGSGRRKHWEVLKTYRIRASPADVRPSPKGTVWTMSTPSFLPSATDHAHRKQSRVGSRRGPNHRRWILRDMTFDSQYRSQVHRLPSPPLVIHALSIAGPAAHDVISPTKHEHSSRTTPSGSNSNASTGPPSKLQTPNHFWP